MDGFEQVLNDSNDLFKATDQNSFVSRNKCKKNITFSCVEKLKRVCLSQRGGHFLPLGLIGNATMTQFKPRGCRYKLLCAVLFRGRGHKQSKEIIFFQSRVPSLVDIYFWTTLKKTALVMTSRSVICNFKLTFDLQDQVRVEVEAHQAVGRDVPQVVGFLWLRGDAEAAAGHQNRA